MPRRGRTVSKVPKTICLVRRKLLGSYVGSRCGISSAAAGRCLTSNSHNLGMAATAKFAQILRLACFAVEVLQLRSSSPYRFRLKPSSHTVPRTRPNCHRLPSFAAVSVPSTRTVQSLSMSRTACDTLKLQHSLILVTNTFLHDAPSPLRMHQSNAQCLYFGGMPTTCHAVM